MNTMFLLSFVWLLASCGVSMQGDKDIIKSPFAGDSVYKTLLIEKEDKKLIPAFTAQSITSEKLKVISGVTTEEISYKLLTLPTKGKLFLEGQEVVLRQDISQADLERGALVYQHLSIPGEDFFELVAWTKDAQSKKTKFEFNIDIPLPRSCSYADGSGIQTWETETDAYGACVLNDCDPGFYLENGACLPQICTPNDVVACALPANSFGVGSKTCNTLGSDYSSCSLDTCDAGYHKAGEVCELDIIPCTVSGGEGLQTWNGSAYGTCVVTNCNSSYYKDGNACYPQVCSPNVVSSCSILNGTGSTICNANGSATGPCLVQSCNAGYEFSGNSCSAIPVTCSYTSLAGPFYEGVGITVPSPLYSGYNVQFRPVSSLASGVSLDTTNGSVSIPVPTVQTYNLNIEAYSATSATSCGVLNLVVNNSLVATDDSFTTKQGQAIAITYASILSNDYSLVGRNFSLSSISEVTGGTVATDGTIVTFTPNVLTGDYAAFDYTIVDSYGTSNTGRVVINITPLDPIEALIFGSEDLAELNQVLNTAPPTMQDLFDKWGRFEAENYYANKAEAQGEALSWEFQTNPDRVQSNVNSSKYIGFISPEKLDKYTLEVDVSSSDNDDDAISVLVAFVRDGGKNYTLSAVRTQGGTHTNIIPGWALVYNYMQSDEVILGQLDVGGTFPNYLKTGWSNRSSRIKIVRNGDSVKVWSSPWATTDITDASLISVNLNSHPYLAIFKGKQSYGYGAFSQKYATYKNISLQGGSNLDATTVYDADKEQVWTYTPGTGWVLSSQSFAESLGYPRTIYNPETGKTFVIDHDGNTSYQ